MFRTMTTALLASALVLTACDTTPTGLEIAEADDYALVMFGEVGSALEGTMGTQPGHHPVDGRSGRPTLPPELALTDAQQAEITALREAFAAANAEPLAQLKAIFDEARAAKQTGKSREEVRAILEKSRAIAEGLRPAVQALHDAVWNVHTVEQQAWLTANRPKPSRSPMHRGRGGHGRRP